MSGSKEHRPNEAAAEGGRPIGSPPKAAPVFLIILYHRYLWIFLIYSLYIPYIYIYIFHIYFLAMFHIFSLVRFLIYVVKSRSGHDRSQSYLSHSVAQIIMRIKVRFYFGHVRTYSWLHKLRNTQGKIYGTYLRKIYGIHQEYIKNIHEYL